MINEKIELYKVRDLSDRINTTFAFVKQNGKQIARNFLYLIPVYLVAAIFTGYFHGQLYASSAYGYYDPYSVIFSGAYFLSLLASIAVAITSFVALLFVICYVAEYEESSDATVDDSKVWARVKKSFLGSLGGSILVGIAVFIGLIFCIIPGIWLAVSFSVFMIAYIVERSKPISGNVLDCIGESYNLVKQDWFGSFGYLFVMGIIALAFYLVLSIPSMLSGVSTILLPNSGGTNIFFTAFAYALYYIGSLFVSTITSVATALLYFDLKERQDGLSLHKRIDNIGQSSDF